MHWTECARLFVARAALGWDGEWDHWGPPCLSFSYGGDTFVVGKGKPHLRLSLTDLDVARLLAHDFASFFANVKRAGRISHALLVHAGLTRKPGSTGAPESIVRPHERPHIVTNLVARLLESHSARALERTESMLRMWSGEEPYDDERLLDFVIPGAKPRPWFGADEFDWSKECLPLLSPLTAATRDFAQGRAHLPAYHEASLEWSDASPTRWGRGVIYQGGETSAQAKLTPVFEEIGRLARDNGRLYHVALLSLQPGTVLRRHSDGFPHAPSWHLGLWVPGDCALEVNGEVRPHEVGKIAVFDDSYVHSASNRSKEQRIVLSAWTVHPAFTRDEAGVVLDASKAMGWCT